MGVELGIWQVRYQNIELPWLRWWNNQGDFLKTDGRGAIAANRSAIATPGR
ncbi:hypothetical protein [Nostoc sp. XA010]|uniref:hypothetical protein n=1 Tax=Nostoc sp. XA010 TaxID=2780407 RepID=UPI0027DFC8AA|nr:hypothetical protein [Nostoc sp. XA010]